MTEQEHKLVNALLEALMLEWHDNGNVCADSIRDACVDIVAGTLGISVDEIVAMIDKRADDLQ